MGVGGSTDGTPTGRRWRTETLEGAKHAAIKAAGLDASKVNWENIGPVLENLPD